VKTLHPPSMVALNAVASFGGCSTTPGGATCRAEEGIVRRCSGSATEDFDGESARQTNGVPQDSWDATWTAKCNHCGKRASLYPVGSTLAREAGGAYNWRLRTHYRSSRSADQN